MIRHATASAVVLDDAGRVLLVWHRKSGLWMHPGGHVEPGEDPARAAVREVAEETGVGIALLGRPAFDHPAVRSHPAPWAVIEMGVVDRRAGDHRPVDHVYVARAGGAVTVRLDEVADARWVPVGELPDLPTPVEIPALIEAAARWASQEVAV